MGCLGMVEFLKEILGEIGDEQADLDKLEKQNEDKMKSVPSTKKYMAMDPSQISLIATDSYEIKRAFKLLDYDFHEDDDKRKCKEPKCSDLQKVIVPYSYLRDFFRRIEAARPTLSRFENLYIGRHLELHVAKDRPLKVVLPLMVGKDDATNNKSGEVVFWLAPRVESG